MRSRRAVCLKNAVARDEPQLRFNALMGLRTDPDGWRESFEQDGTNAPGVDGVSKEDYAEGLGQRLDDLSARLRRLGDIRRPVPRASAPKGDGRYRPLGVRSFEDRLVQDRVSRILQAIWEPDFCDCSYGVPPGRSACDALRRVAEVTTNGQTQWVVEAAIDKRNPTMKDLLPAATIALTMAACPAHAAKQMIVCRDANGNAFFTDVSCPAEATRESTRSAPEAQTYSGRESIDIDRLNNYERRVGSGTTWQWSTKAAPGGAGR